MDDITSLLNSVNFSMGWVIASLIFSSVGFVAFMYGKKRRLWRPIVIGIVLMVYTYVLSNVLVISIVGTILTAALFFWHD
jgi:hypothetical protein